MLHDLTFGLLWLLPVVYMCDCRRSVAKDPGLDVHGLGFGVGYGHIYDPLEAFTFTTCDGGHTQSKDEWTVEILTYYTFNIEMKL